MPMDSKTYITLDLQAPNVAVVAAGKQNDLASRKIVAQLRDGETLWTPPAGVAAMIRYAKPDGTAGFYDVLEDGTTPAWSVSGSTITITLCEQMLTVAGRVWVEINFYTSTAKLTTFYFLLEVQRSVLEDATIISSDYYNVLSAQIQALLGATANPPQIDPITKNWLLWDEETGAYVDSGFSSVGLTGPVFTPSVSAAGVISWTNNGGLPNPTSRNITGPQGVSITGTERVSGTGAPGTTDTYNVNLSNGNVGGTFDVYNGSDGQGSPGTSTPLSDSGSGVVGTATAYSRENHRHPLNVDSTNPAPLGTAAPGTASAYARRDHVHAMPTAPDVGAMSKWTLLWTNASPTSSFASQTVPIDLTGYDKILVKLRFGTTSGPAQNAYFHEICDIGETTALYCLNVPNTAGSSIYPNLAARNANVSTSGVAFGTGLIKQLSTAGNPSEDNTACIPYKIYGIKGVQ